MHATHDSNDASRQPRAFGGNLLGRLFTDQGRFRAWIASATGTAAPAVTTPDTTDPDGTDSVGFVLTDKGRQAATAARRCDGCGEPMPGVYAWDMALCPDCVTTVPADNEYGYVVVADPDSAKVEQAPGAGDVLRNAARYLERYGWIQGAYYDTTATGFTPAACVVGAIGMVCYGGPVDAPAQHFDDPGFLDFEEAVLHLDRYLLVEDGTQSYEFNDAKGRQVEDVSRVLRDAASRPADELIDAIKAIDARNAQLAALVDLLKPGGIFAEQVKPESPDVEDFGDDDEVSLVDCLFCGAPGGYPYCEGSFSGGMSCADVAAADDTELAAQDGDVR